MRAIAHVPYGRRVRSRLGVLPAACVGGVLLLGSSACRDDSTAVDGSKVSAAAASPVTAAATSVQLDDACDRAPDTEWVTFGTVNTIIVQPVADVIDVQIVPTPAAVCPGGTFAVELSVTNRSDDAVVFLPNRGLLLQSGGMTNWEVAPMEATNIGAGTTVVIDVVATIPNVQPGRYALAAEGFTSSTAFDVLEPTG